jgi:Tripartite tricarboxylate transporter family receptor
MRMSCPSSFVGAPKPGQPSRPRGTLWYFPLFRHRPKDRIGAGFPDDDRESSERTTVVSRERIRTGITAALGCALFLVFGGAASAQDAGNYPNKPVLMIVPFAPGGASDFVARTLQAGVSQILGQQVVIDNRTGAGGVVGTELAARATPDGYTAFLGNVGTISINPSVYSDMHVKPDKELAPVSICADTPSILCVPKTQTRT